LLLRDYMIAELAGWEQDLTRGWRALLGDVAFDFGAIALDLNIGDPPYLTPPRRPGRGALHGGSIFRAFSAMEPESVRVLVIGQDPYPLSGRATGRAFEDGLFSSWERGVANSLKALRRAAVASRLERSDLLSAKTLPWRSFLRETSDIDELRFESMSEWFDRLAGQGVLFVNAAMTLTHYRYGGCREQRAHLDMWRPFMGGLMRGLADRIATPPVHLLLGGFAQDLQHRIMVTERDPQVRPASTPVRTVEHWHPLYHRFLESNPFDEVNRVLTGTPINW